MSFLRDKRMRIFRVLVCCLFALALPHFSTAQMKHSQDASAQVREFVQEFYDWYVPKARADNPGPAWDLALKSKGSVFSPDLARALKEDLQAQAKAQGEIVGLDFDPFLSAQDPCERYEAGSVVPKGTSYWVEVYGVCSGKRHEKADVVAELIQKDDHCVFVNFHYPKDRNLLAVLKSLREDREKPVK
jgi:hypothetical protein